MQARSGLAMNPVPPGEAPRVPMNGVGDRVTGMTLAAGVSAALVRLARTGKGSVVETSLMHTGAFVNGGRCSFVRCFASVDSPHLISLPR